MSYQQPYGQPYGGGPQMDHPQATTVLVLGIVGLIVCPICAPIAWVMGNSAVREIDESQGQYGGRSQAVAGRVLGIVGSLIILLGIIVVVGLAAAGALAVSSG